MLLTDNSILIDAAKRNDDKFLVSVCSVGGIKKKRKYLTEDQSDLDIKTSRNLIGEIINASQELNTRIWDDLANGKPYADVQDMYLDVCKLSIMSGLEIDKAKKEFVVDNAKELSEIRKKYKLIKSGKNIKPNFFAHISKQKGYYNPEKKAYVRHKTAMDYLQHCVNCYRFSRNGQPFKNTYLPFSAVVAREDFCYDNVYDKLIYEMLTSVDELKQKMTAIYSDEFMSNEEKHISSQAIRQEFIESVGAQKFNKDTMISLLITIEKPENKKYSRLLFYTMFGYPNTAFYEVLKKSQLSLPTLSRSEAGDINIFGIKHEATK